MRSQEANQTSSFAPLNQDAAHTAAEKSHLTAIRPWFRKKRFVLPPALVLVLVIILAASGGLGGSDQAKSTARQVVSTATAAGVGSMLRDGRSEFVVTGVQRPGKILAGKAGEKLTAQGEFVIVRVNITNIGDQSRPPSYSCHFLFNNQGKKFQPSSAILSTKEALKFVQQVAPGDTVDGVLMLFDVPTGTILAHIELHDTAQSPGVTVTLS